MYCAKEGSGSNRELRVWANSENRIQSHLYVIQVPVGQSQFVNILITTNEYS